MENVILARSRTNFYHQIYKEFNNSIYIKSDPLELVYILEGHKEYISFITAIFSYGRVNSIKKFLKKFFISIGRDPFNINSTFDKDIYYRFQNSKDIKILVSLLKYVYTNFNSLENFFLSFSNNLELAYTKFIEFARTYGANRSAGRGYYFLFPKDNYLTSKRYNMFFRWMVRKDSIDLGLWKNYSPKELKYPLDTHILNFAYNTGLIKYKQCNYKNINALDKYFKKISSNDPVKFDFSLTRLGIIYKCKFIYSDSCRFCPYNNSCIYN
ncbi:MAG: TIGR02757 family protein [Deferribacterota bacterium]|nr:TIGR02757 family protein [Deferribacterota bacterium]